MDDLDKTKLVSLLRKQGYRCELDEQDALSVITTLNDGEERELWLDLKVQEPCKIPEFTIALDKYPEFIGKPHVGSKGGVCVFNASSNFVNPCHTEATILESLEQTIRLLNTDLTATTDEAYKDEYLAYWSLENQYFRVYLFDDRPSKNTIFYGAIRKVSNETELYVASTKEKATSIWRKLPETSTKASPKLIPCLTLELHDAVLPIPKTYKNWYRAIKTNSDSFQAYCDYARKIKERGYILIKVNPHASVDDNSFWLAFCHHAVPPHNGFRKRSKRLLDYVMEHDAFGNKEPWRGEVKLMTQERLFYRGGDGVIFNKTFALVGCGSLGSNFAKTLSDIGVSKFLLFDNDFLTDENIMRRICGFNFLGKDKNKALKDFLEQRNPNIECQTFEKDAVTHLHQNPQVFLKADYCVISTGEPASEFYFIDAFVNKKVSCPLIIMWVEPYALAGHALVIEKPSFHYGDSFDEETKYFKDNVVINQEDFLKQEAGCQSTFVPYAVLDIQMFIIDFIRSYFRSGEFKKKQNRHFVWLGRLSKAKELSAKIADKYKALEDYTYCYEDLC